MEQPAMRFFLDEAPLSAALSALPPDSREPSAARVRVVGVTGLMPRSGPPRGPLDAPKVELPHPRSAELEVVAVTAGHGAGERPPGLQQRWFAEFGRPAPGARDIFPPRSERGDREYFVVSYVDGRGKRALTGFAVPDRVYDEWFSRLVRSMP